MSLEQFGLGEDATEADVQRRFKELARAAHPDVGGSAEQFQALQAQREQALKEVQLGTTLANSRSALHRLREAARGAKCPRCDGTGEALRRDVPGSFKPFIKRCSLCRGTGKLQ